MIENKVYQEPYIRIQNIWKALTSILDPNTISYRKSMSENFIHMHANKSTGYCDFSLCLDEKHFPALSIKSSLSDSFHNKKEWLDRIVDYLRKGYYVILYVDKFYLSEHNSYMRFHFADYLLICGVDELRDELICRDCFGPTTAFRKAICTVTEVYEAYVHANDAADTKDIIYVKQRKENKDGINARQIKSDLIAFLETNITSEKISCNLEVFKSADAIIQSKIRENYGSYYCFLTNVYTLIEDHMNIMAYRMSVLLDSFHIVEKCNEYAKRVSHCRNQVMRSRMICLKTKEFIGNDTKDFLCQENHSIHNQYMELVNDIIAELKNN